MGIGGGIMDCPSEENMIRLKLEGLSEIKKLEFDLENRKLTILHTKQVPEIENKINDLKLGSKLLGITEIDYQEDYIENKFQTRLLWMVLIINFVFFVIEITTGFISNSMGLVADSLDMLADSIVYGLSIFAVGAVVSIKKKVASLSGYFQILLALLGFFEIIRRFLYYDKIPDFKIMIIISIFALIANAISLFILQKSKSNDAHMKASMIFTSNDIIINIGVIIAGILVLITNSKFPDLIIGTIVFIIVVQSAIRILKLGK